MTSILLLAVGATKGWWPSQRGTRNMRQGQVGKIDGQPPPPPGQQILNAAIPRPGGKFGCCLCDNGSGIYAEI